MDPTEVWSGSSAWYRMDLGLLGCRMNHTNWVLLSMDTGRSRRCSDDAELHLPITIVQSKFLGRQKNLLLDNETLWRSKGKKSQQFKATAGLLDVAWEAVQSKQGILLIR